ncbi:hypothetical protein BOX15_Mlig001885g2 [Macrostomum lignano]|uniref:Sodium/potassium-transporting ATPase subunit beta n=2 Tax=Macrostomum lignano TaxID=282301 RepID=A0A1I8GX12_9PLAT|nr:hypothetical protein BOX15_Mlig001885g4 [Macrostomum lignano]PAA90630.1 hypothetical protein BOX15_Mlig001885g2 [Macrostomum lignano]
MTDDNKPTCGQRMSACGRFLYNKDRGTFLGRTPKSWALITIFYLIYYSCLAAFFVGMLSVLLFGIIDDTKPMLTGEQSLIRMNPGLGMRPMPDVERTLINVNASDQKNLDRLVGNLDQLVNSYSSVNKSLEDPNMEYANCNLEDAEANRDFDPKKKICRIDPSKHWGNCTSANKFGYESATPCVIIKMNKIYGWLPDIEDPQLSNHTLMRCEPENDGDKATFGSGSLLYYPGVTVNGTDYGYFSSALFPYLNQKGYTTPTVAVRFPNARRNVLLMVSCRLYNIKNYRYDKMDRDGMVRFELLIVNTGSR